jgi:hypothetical protein
MRILKKIKSFFKEQSTGNINKQNAKILKITGSDLFQTRIHLTPDNSKRIQEKSNCKLCGYSFKGKPCLLSGIYVRNMLCLTPFVNEKSHVLKTILDLSSTITDLEYKIRVEKRIFSSDITNTTIANIRLKKEKQELFDKLIIKNRKLRNENNYLKKKQAIRDKQYKPDGLTLDDSAVVQPDINKKGS